MRKQIYIPLEQLRNTLAKNDYNKWACDMLEMIAQDEWWKEIETAYFKKFYQN